MALEVVSSVPKNDKAIHFLLAHLALKGMGFDTKASALRAAR
jgi:hypothetical protein